MSSEIDDITDYIDAAEEYWWEYELNTDIEEFSDNESFFGDGSKSENEEIEEASFQPSESWQWNQTYEKDSVIINEENAKFLGEESIVSKEVPRKGMLGKTSRKMERQNQSLHWNTHSNRIRQASINWFILEPRQEFGGWGS